MRSDDAEVTSAGRSFNVRAPPTRKARRPTVGSLAAGTSRSSDEENSRFVDYWETVISLEKRLC